MIKYDNFEQIYQELIDIHTYISKKRSKILKLFIFLEILLTITLFIFAALQNDILTIVFGILLMISCLLLIPYFTLKNKFVRGNFIDKVINEVNLNTNYKINKQDNSKKTIFNKSSLINKNFSISCDFIIDVVDQKDPSTILFSFAFGNFMYGKNISYSGSVIIINNTSIKCNYHILSEYFINLSQNYVKDKELTNSFGLRKEHYKKHYYFYDRKNINNFDDKISDVFGKVEDYLNQDHLIKYKPTGISTKDGSLTILIPKQPNKYNFGFIKKFNQENVETYINDLISLFDLILEIKENVGE